MPWYIQRSETAHEEKAYLTAKSKSSSSQLEETLASGTTDFITSSETSVAPMLPSKVTKIDAREYFSN